MAASLGNLEPLLNFSGPVTDLFGVTVAYHTDVGLFPNQVLGAVTAVTTGALGPGATLLTPNQNGQQRLFTVAAVDDATNTITLLITVGGVRVGELTDYVLGFYPSFILYGTEPSTAAARKLDQGITASGTLGIISPAPLATGSAITFLPTYAYVGSSTVTYAIAAADATKAEGNSGLTPFTFFVTRAGDTSQPATFTYAVNGSGTNQATADDFVGGALPHGTVTFAPGASSETIVVNVQGDTTVEQDETFGVTLTGGPPGADVTTASATGTISTTTHRPARSPCSATTTTRSSRPARSPWTRRPPADQATCRANTSTTSATASPSPPARRTCSSTAAAATTPSR